MRSRCSCSERVRGLLLYLLFFTILYFDSLHRLDFGGLDFGGLDFGGLELSAFGWRWLRAMGTLFKVCLLSTVSLLANGTQSAVMLAVCCAVLASERRVDAIGNGTALEGVDWNETLACGWLW